MLPDDPVVGMPVAAGKETGGKAAIGDGPRGQATVSPGSKEILLICETRALPAKGMGGDPASCISDGFGERLGDELAEKGEG